MVRKPEIPTPVSDETSRIAAVLPPGCELPGCKHHFSSGRNLAAEGCICPAWFDGGGWHLIERNADCGAHRSDPEEN